MVGTEATEHNTTEVTIMSSYRTGAYARFHASEVTRKANAEFLRIMHDGFTNQEYVHSANIVDCAMLPECSQES
jgi:hypothetical protein